MRAGHVRIARTLLMQWRKFSKKFVNRCPHGLTRFFRVTYTRKGAIRAGSPQVEFRPVPVWPRAAFEGRLAQLVRAPALQAGGRRFESCTAHHNPLIYTTFPPRSVFRYQSVSSSQHNPAPIAI